MLATEALSADWTRHLCGGRIAVGYDVATTEKKTSNPSAITVSEEWGGLFWQRLVVRFKTADPEAAFQILEAILSVIERRLLLSLNIDASNEKYHARTVKARFRKYCRVNLIVSGETLVFEQEKYSFKTLLGNLYVSAFEDHKIAQAAAEWLVKDHRLVKNHNGGYATELDDEGNHGDTFDSGKLAHWGHVNRSKHSTDGIAGLQVGGIAKQAGGRQGLDRVLTIARRQCSFGIPGEASTRVTS
jgi:hypothetical protein